MSIERHRGDTKPIVFQLWEDKEAGTKLDITGFSFKFTVNKKRDPSVTDTPEFSLDHELVGLITEGKIRFLPSATQMDLEILTDPYWFDLEVTDADGFISTELLDKFKITQDITK